MIRLSKTCEELKKNYKAEKNRRMHMNVVSYEKWERRGKTKRDRERDVLKILFGNPEASTTDSKHFQNLLDKQKNR